MNIIQPTSMFTSPEKFRGAGGSCLISVDYLCQQWLRKSTVSYLHQYHFLSKDCKIRIYNAFILLDFRYCTIVCHLCSRQPIYKRERNPKQGIPSSCKWSSDVISKFTECSLSPNSLYGSHMKNIAIEMFKCLNNTNPKRQRATKSLKCWLPTAHNLVIESSIFIRNEQNLFFIYLFKTLPP